MLNVKNVERHITMCSGLIGAKRAICLSHFLYNTPAISGSCSPLAELHHNEDLWEIICNQLSGDALSCLDSVKFFSRATRRTAAFILLAGINNDAEAVPWTDPTNVLSDNHDPFCALCKAFWCKHQGCDYDREMVAIKTAEAMLCNVEYPIYMRKKPCHDDFSADLMVQLMDHPKPYIRKGPARPSTPFECSDAAYDPIIEDGCARIHDLNPPVFGVRPGFTYAPFWDVLVYDGDGVYDSDDSDC